MPLKYEHGCLVSELCDDIDMNVVRRFQQEDLVLGKIVECLTHRKNLLNAQDVPYKYSHIWKQLKLSDGVLWREYQVNGFGEVQSVVVVPTK